MKHDVNIDQTLYQTYSDIRLGLLQFHAEVKDSDNSFWDYMNNEVQPKIKAEIEGEEWNTIPGVKGSRAAYKAFGRNPGRYRVSSEALLRRIRRGDELYHVNSVVDVNNLISVESGLSVGSYDLAHIHGAVTLRKAEKGEGYTGIGKGFLDLENLLVLADSEGIFGSSMSDSTRAMVTEDTTDVLVVIYCFENDIDLQTLLNHAKEAFQTFADAQYTAGADQFSVPAVFICSFALIALDIYKAVQDDADAALFDFHPNPNPACFVGGNIRDAMEKPLHEAQLAMEQSLAGYSLQNIIDYIDKKMH